MLHTVTIEEMKADLAALVARAGAGERIIITGPDRRPLACLGELPKGVPIPGRGIGQITVNEAVPVCAPALDVAVATEVSDDDALVRFHWVAVLSACAAVRTAAMSLFSVL